MDELKSHQTFEYVNGKCYDLKYGQLANMLLCDNGKINFWKGSKHHKMKSVVNINHDILLNIWKFVASKLLDIALT